MELRAGELQAPQAGLYYIYAQTYFRLSSSGEADGEGEEAAQLVQYIYKKVRLEIEVGNISVFYGNLEI